jgi:hypothetical protein
LIVEEADFLLDTKEDRNSYRVTADKGYLNQFLDNSHIKTIWISNEVGSMEESTLRRFSYSLHFKAFTEKEQLNIWNTVLKEHPVRSLFSDSLIATPAKEYKINAGGIASALSTISAYLSANDSNHKNFEVACDSFNKRQKLFVRRKWHHDFMEANIMLLMMHQLFLVIFHDNINKSS